MTNHDHANDVDHDRDDDDVDHDHDRDDVVHGHDNEDDYGYVGNTSDDADKNGLTYRGKIM